MDLHLSISKGFVSSKIYDKCDDFDFHIVNFPFTFGDVPRATSYGVYISQLIRFAGVSSHVTDFMPVIKVQLPNFSNRAIAITETSPCALGNFRKWLLYKCFMSLSLIVMQTNIKFLKITVTWTNIW